jgi:hypothetical protein
MFGVAEPGRVILEAECLRAASRVTAQRAHPFLAGCEIDVNLNVSHH